jgi:hypothetical protein
MEHGRRGRLKMMQCLAHGQCATEVGSRPLYQEDGDARRTRPVNVSKEAVKSQFEPALVEQESNTQQHTATDKWGASGRLRKDGEWIGAQSIS